MTAGRQVELLELGRRKLNEFIDECIELIEDNGSEDAEAPAEAADRTMLTTGPHNKQWELGDDTLRFKWKPVAEEKGQTYRWPDGNIDEYDRFVTYRAEVGDGTYAFAPLALGYLANGDVVGFVLGGSATSKRGITYFFPADDFEETREKVSMIRGGGPTGRSGFEPGEPLPKAYASIKTDVLRDRVAGKWNVQAVVVKEDDFKTMLTHTALQARLRKLA